MRSHESLRDPPDRRRLGREALEPEEPILAELFSVERLEQHAQTPAVVSAVEATGVSVTSIQTTRPSFDEVFVRLVERAAGRLPGDAEAGEATRFARPGPGAAAGPPPTVAGAAAVAEDA